MRLTSAALASLLFTTVSHAEPPRVITDVAPIHSLVSHVMEGVGEPELLIPALSSPHGYALKPSQARLLSNADLIFWVGEPLTPWLEKALSTLARDVHRIELLEIGGVTLLSAGKKEDIHDEAGHHDDHDHSDIDPHIWLDPINARAIVNAVAKELARIDPDNADQYRRNADEASKSLGALTDTVAASMAPARGKRYIVQHDGYRYFEARFGLGRAIPISNSHAANAGARRLAEIRQAIVDIDARCIFGEAQLEQKTINAVTRGSEIRVETLDPMGAIIEPGPKLYDALIRAQATVMKDCLK